MDDFKLAIKLATKRLVEKAGGVLAAQAATNYSSTSWSNSYRLEHDATAPIPHILSLEDFVGRPVVTREMARVQGYDLVPIAAQTPKEVNFDAALLSATKELGDAISVLAGRNHFEDLAVYQRAEWEALEAREASQRLLDEVRRRRPGHRAALRLAEDAE